MFDFPRILKDIEFPIKTTSPRASFPGRDVTITASIFGQGRFASNVIVHYTIFIFTTKALTIDAHDLIQYTLIFQTSNKAFMCLYFLRLYWLARQKKACCNQHQKKGDNQRNTHKACINQRLLQDAENPHRLTVLIRSRRHDRGWQKQATDPASIMPPPQSGVWTGAVISDHSSVFAANSLIPRRTRPVPVRPAHILSLYATLPRPGNPSQVFHTPH